MPRGKKPSYALAEDRDGRLVPVPSERRSDGVPPVLGVSDGESRTEAAGEGFKWLLERDDGWLRAIPCGEGKLNYFKWKFSSGVHKGKYVMFVGHVNDWSGSILGLVEKLEEVDSGLRKPALDTFYDPR